MEKIIYALWQRESQPPERFQQNVLGGVVEAVQPFIHGLRINLPDNTVSGGTSLRASSTRPAMSGLIQLWVDSASDIFRFKLDEVMESVSVRFAAWLAVESTVIPNTSHVPTPPNRTDGFSQIAFLGRPPRLTAEAWQYIWQAEHTQVAMSTQSQFEYIQNLLIRPLTHDAPPYVAMIEECYPIEALVDEAVFFNAVGDPDKLEKNRVRLWESCDRFIDRNRLDCFPTSQFDLKPIRELNACMHRV